MPSVILVPLKVLSSRRLLVTVASGSFTRDLNLHLGFCKSAS